MKKIIKLKSFLWLLLLFLGFQIALCTKKNNSGINQINAGNNTFVWGNNIFNAPLQSNSFGNSVEAKNKRKRDDNKSQENNKKVRKTPVTPVQNLQQPQVVIQSHPQLAPSTEITGNSKNTQSIIEFISKKLTALSVDLVALLNIVHQGSFTEQQKNTLLKSISDVVVKKSDEKAFAFIKEKFADWLTKNKKDLLLYAIDQEKTEIFKQVIKDMTTKELYALLTTSGDSYLAYAINKQSKPIITIIWEALKKTYIVPTPEPSLQKEAYVCVVTCVEYIEKFLSPLLLQSRDDIVELIVDAVGLLLDHYRQYSGPDQNFENLYYRMHDLFLKEENIYFLNKYITKNLSKNHFECLKNDIMFALNKSKNTLYSSLVSLMPTKEFLSFMGESKKNLLDFILEKGAQDDVQKLLERIVIFLKSDTSGKNLHEISLFLWSLREHICTNANTLSIGSLKPLMSAYIDIAVHAIMFSTGEQKKKHIEQFGSIIEKLSVIALKKSSSEGTQKMLELLMLSLVYGHETSSSDNKKQTISGASILRKYENHARARLFLHTIIALIILQGLDDSLMQICCDIFSIDTPRLKVLLDMYIKEDVITLLKEIAHSPGYNATAALTSFVNSESFLQTEKTVLVLAIEQKKQTVVTLLLDQGACPVKPTRISKKTPFALAIKSDAENIQKLLVHSFDIDQLKMLFEGGYLLKAKEDGGMMRIFCGTEVLDIPQTSGFQSFEYYRQKIAFDAIKNIILPWRWFSK